MPGAVRQVMWVWFPTLQFTPRYSTPDGPYVTPSRNEGDAGPKLAPAITTTSPPYVDPFTAPGPVMAYTRGTSYAVVGATECCPSITSDHVRPLPAPGAV